MCTWERSPGVLQCVCPRCAVLQGTHSYYWPRLMTLVSSVQPATHLDTMGVYMAWLVGVPERSYRMEEIKATVQMLVNLVDTGYRIAHLGGWVGSGGGAWLYICTCVHHTPMV